YARNGQVLLSSGKDESVRVWDAKTGESLAVQPADRDWIRQLAVSGDGDTLATAGKEGSLRTWSIAQIFSDVLRGHENWGLPIAFAPDGKTIVSGGRDRTIRFWDAESGKPLHTLAKLDGDVTSIAWFGKDKKLKLAAAINDGAKGEIKIWEVTAGDKFELKE